jgi:hypothetical protein
MEVWIMGRCLEKFRLQRCAEAKGRVGFVVDCEIDLIESFVSIRFFPVFSFLAFHRTLLNTLFFRK